MIKKEITLNDGRKYIVGFKEVGSQNECIECHILKKIFFIHVSVYNKFYIKTLIPDYQELAIWTIFNYERKLKQHEDLLVVNWS
jgi:hypothetical protein